MRWHTLAKQILAVDPKTAERNNVYAKIWDVRSGQYERVYLTLKHDAYGRPYLIMDARTQAAYEKQRRKR